jgi:putative ABC transport system permease protein
VWLRTTQDADTVNIIRSINNLGISVVTVQDARALVNTAFASPNRQGMLGMLSVGFLAALALTVVGFWLYALTSVQERFIQLGVLRAIGFSIKQVGAALALEQLFLTLIALGVGTGIAVLTSLLYIPHLPASIGTHPGVPPYLVEIAWGEMFTLYAAFGVVLLVGVGFAIVSLGQMKIFQTVKLGESV